MIDITENQKQTEKNESSHKELKLVFNDSTIGTITNDRIYSESMELVESLCDLENLKFGQCESAQFSVQVADVNTDLKNKEFQAILAYTDHEISLGYFIVTEVEKATDKRYKKLTCYDRMYYMNLNVVGWYNSLFRGGRRISLDTFRNTFFSMLGLEQEEIELPNDRMYVSKTIDDEEISAIRVIQAICEVNGVFGHFNREGVFEYVNVNNRFSIYPSEDLYPSSNLYPDNYDSIEIEASECIPPLERADYSVKEINALKIQDGQDDLGVTVTDSSSDDDYNCYVISDNFLLYGKGEEELTEIAYNILYQIVGIHYIPHKTSVLGMPYIEVGDKFSFSFTSEPFASLILKRTLHGIQALRDTYEAQGDEKMPEIINSTNPEMVRLQSRVNILKRTVDENYLEITRLFEVDGKVVSMSSAIQQTADAINLKVSKDRLVSEINASAEGIKISASKVDISGLVTFSDLETQGKTTINGANIMTDSVISNKVTATNLEVNGDSKIGEWLFTGGTLYNGIPYAPDKEKDLHNEKSTGIGTHGGDWAFWAGNGRFSVDQSGNLTATSANIIGAINATSGYISGDLTVLGSLSAPGISMGGTTTYIDPGSVYTYAGGGVTPSTMTNYFNTLYATNAQIGTLSTEVANVSNALIATNASITNLTTGKTQATTINALNLNVSNILTLGSFIYVDGDYYYPKRYIVDGVSVFGLSKNP